VSAEDLAELIRRADAGSISVSVARNELFPAMYRGEGSPAELIRERGLEQVSDDATLRELVREVLAAHPGQLQQYRDGKSGLLGYFVGQVMRRSQGRANPVVVTELLREEIG
jgi:Asp-tRNA(Asn)/Glu-tRNA(Gln) amidotransferase B subunit